jgi:hypothetical protein
MIVEEESNQSINRESKEGYIEVIKQMMMDNDTG